MDKDAIYLEIPRIQENESVFRTDIDWEKEEKELKEGEVPQDRTDAV